MRKTKRTVRTSRRGAEAGDAPALDARGPPSAPFPVVGVGASAGGMESFVELLRGMPPDVGMAFVLIQHLAPTHPSYLSEAVSRAVSLPVHEVEDGMVVEPNHVYVMPSHADVGILRGALTLLPRPADARAHLPVNLFFKALAADRGAQAIGVVLSGTGSDGAEGLRAIKEAEGITFAQDPKSAKFDGMPEAAVRTGAVDCVLPVPALAQELARIGRHPLVRRHESDVLASPAEAGDLDKVLIFLRREVGVDFSEYKSPTIRRRLARRMALRRVESLQQYVRLMRDDPSEVRALFDDIIIQVTSFFRDGEAIEKLKVEVFPEILRQKRDGGTIRIWSAGCASGEEAYSLVIALLEFLDQEEASDVPIQLFGTDIGGAAIDKARAGVYTEADVRNVGAERIKRFFVKQDDGTYCVSKRVRERCAFVTHDLTREPPFSKLDLVSCRNVLIYLGPDLQRRLLATFHFALNEPGFLLLGQAENIPEGLNLFRAVDREAKIFARTAVKSILHLVPAKDFAAAPPRAREVQGRAPSVADLVRHAESVLLDRYSPPGVIVNDRMEILHFRGRTAPFLEPAPGQPRHDLVKMAKKGLVADLRIAVSQAKRGEGVVRREHVRFEQDGETGECDVVVVPVSTSPEPGGELFAVLFETPKPDAPRPVGAAAAPPGEPGPEGAGSAVGELAAVEGELRATKQYLESLIDEHERSTEDLRTANDELVSTNEELQSLNEELQTAKEELQSTNEELATLNEELRTRNRELDTANSDLMNILGSVEVPIVIVDGSRRVRRFTPKARPILNLLPTDVGRPIDDIKPNLAVDGLDRKITEVIETATPVEEEVRDRDGRWFRLQIRPYMSVDRRIDGAVVSVVDIDSLKRALGAAEIARDYARATVEAVRTPLLLLSEGATIVSTNRSFDEHYGLPRSESVGRSVFDVLDGAFSKTGLKTVFLRGLEPFDGLEVELEVPHLGWRALSLSGGSVVTPAGDRLLLVSLEDLTERRRVEAERVQLLSDAQNARASAEAANRSKDDFLATLSHELRTPLSTLLLQAQLLRDAKLDEAQIRRASGVIERATKAQAQLIDDLLDVSRIAAGKLAMELRAVSVAKVVQAAVDLVAESARRKNIELDVRLDESLPPVSGDPGRLQQVVTNLLTNAIKFTSQGRVVVTVDATNGTARLRVSDTGIGIEADFLPRVFSRFVQEVGGRTRTHGGLGLGLAIVRHIVEAHGGTVTAESEGRGKGATFTVLLPLMTDAPAPTPEAPREGTRERLDGVRILVVEDDEATRESLTQMLGLVGANVHAVASAAQASSTLEAFRPELVVCDIAMPDEDGYSLLRRVRALGPERGGDVPALALSALASEDDRQRAFEAGFQVHLAKPVDTTRLVSCLLGLLSRRGSPRPAGSQA